MLDWFTISEWINLNIVKNEKNVIIVCFHVVYLGFWPYQTHFCPHISLRERERERERGMKAIAKILWPTLKSLESEC